jgi:aerobic-type carbon monoxide dehydrogenase small subunit (CoxS/CutS family)
MATISLLVNEKTYDLAVDPAMPLLWVLRDTLGLTGTKYSCGLGLCGACAVHLDGEAHHACTTPVSAAAGRAVTTIEGLSPDGAHPVQQAWIAEQVPQCGYCQPGQIMTAVALLAKNPNPSMADIENGMAGALCRCGTYQRIRLAIQRVAAEGGAR